MIPYLVTPPVELPVALSDMKLHLRAAHDDDDADIEAKQAGAVAMLDAWGGLLGRCIMPQAWAVDVTGPGPHLLPFPDASDVTAEGPDGALDVEVSRTGLGLCATVSDAGSDDDLSIQFVCGLPADRLPAAQSLVKLMVQREYDVMAGSDYDAISRSIDALIGALRWRRL